MFKDGDLIKEVNGGLVYRFQSYKNPFNDDSHDCALYQTEFAFEEKLSALTIYRRSVDFWFLDKRHTLIEKTRKIKR